MKKIILLFAMMLTMVSVQAYDKNIDLSNPTLYNATWDKSTNVLNFTSGGYAEFEVQNVDTYTSVEVIVTANSGSFRIRLLNNVSWYEFGATSKEAQGSSYGAANTKTFDTNVFSTIGSITKIKIYLATGESGSVTVPSICFKGLDVNSNTEGFSGLTFKGTQTNLLAKTTPFVVNQADFNFLLGNSTAKDGTSNYLDVTNYDALYFEVTDWKSAAQLRANVGTTNPSSLYYAHKITDIVSDWTTSNNIDGNGWYYINLSDVTALRAVSTQSLGSASERFTVSKMYLVKSTFTITDGKDASDVMYDPLGTSVAYDRSFTKDQVSTICLPFALSSSEVSATGGKFYKFESATADQLKFSEVSETSAYTPYLFVAVSNTTPFSSLTDKEIVASEGATTTVTKNGFSFIGTLAKTDISSGAYGFSGGELKKAGSGVTIKAFRGYFTGAFSGARSLDIDLGDESVTGISKIQTETSNDAPIYNLNGQRVSTDYKGIVIQNGKKVIKK